MGPGRSHSPRSRSPPAAALAPPTQKLGVTVLPPGPGGGRSSSRGRGGNPELPPWPVGRSAGWWGSSPGPGRRLSRGPPAASPGLAPGRQAGPRAQAVWDLGEHRGLAGCASAPRPPPRAAAPAAAPAGTFQAAQLLGEPGTRGWALPAWGGVGGHGLLAEGGQSEQVHAVRGPPSTGASSPGALAGVGPCPRRWVSCSRLGRLAIRAEPGAGPGPRLHLLRAPGLWAPLSAPLLSLASGCGRVRHHPPLHWSAQWGWGPRSHPFLSPGRVFSPEKGGVPSLVARGREMPPTPAPPHAAAAPPPAVIKLFGGSQRESAFPYQLQKVASSIETQQKCGRAGCGDPEGASGQHPQLPPGARGPPVPEEQGLA